MDIILFIGLITVGITANGLLVECVKGIYNDYKIKYSSNVLALGCACFIGTFGSLGSLYILNMEYTLNHLLLIPGSVILIWMGSMLGYDKIIQLLVQIKETLKK